MSERNVILKVEHLSKIFRIKGKSLIGQKLKLHALQDINLEVYEGETLGIIGESGCGKSTLGRCLVQLYNATSGAIIYDGKNVTGLRGKAKKELCKDIQMVFQDPYSSLDPRHTAAYSIAEPMIAHNTVTGKEHLENRVLQLLKQVGMDVQHMSRYPHEFSGGQRQRLNIARAISIHPKVVICDEPVSALDVSVQAQVINLLKRLQRKYNLTYLFISHDLSVVKHISDRIAIMYLGTIVELCECHDVYDNPLHPYTQALLSAIPPENPEEKKVRIILQGEVPSPIGNRLGCPLVNRCPKALERCREEIPKLMPHGRGNHQVACFLYQPQMEENHVK